MSPTDELEILQEELRDSGPEDMQDYKSDVFIDKMENYKKPSVVQDYIYKH